ncbi:MAG: insulinase family protein [FCB group bacterium]|nr:insulinase family protein [FCB group bacterium]
MKYLLTLLLIASASFAAEPEIYYLDNGMQVVLIENHASPVIASSIVIHNGLRDESLNIIGASHFLEHLLFNGTTRRTQEELYEEMDMLGGYNNAHTGDNFTNFVILANRDNFENALDIQADMIFNSTLPSAKFDKEKGIVTEEIGQSHDRAGYTADIHFASRFFKGTPYAFQVLGTKQSIQNMNRDDLMDYYHSHYLPNNMTAIVTGDFRKSEIKKTIDDVLGTIPPGELPERPFYLPEWPEGPGIADVYYHSEDTKNVLLRVGLPGPDRMGADFFTAEVLQHLLNKEIGASFMEGENPLAQSAGVEYFSDRDFGAFILKAQLTSESRVDEAVKVFQDAFYKISRKNPDVKDIQNFVMSGKSQSLFYSERPHFWAMMKAYLMGFHGYEFAADYYTNLAEVTPQEVSNLAAELFETAVFVPTAIIPFEEEKEETAEESGPKTLQETLDNGLEMMIAPGSGSGIFAAHFLFKGRSLKEPEGKTGITNLLHNSLVKGTSLKDEETLQNEMNRMGMNLEVTDNPWIPYDNYRTSPEFSYIRMEVPVENWEEALKLTAEVILNPSFSPQNIEPVKGMTMGVIGRSSESASAISRSTFMTKLLGDHVLTMDTDGNMRSLPGITAADLQNYHAGYFTADNLILSIVADADGNDVANSVKKLFGKMTNSGLPQPVSPAPAMEVGEFRETLGKRQSYIRLGYLLESLPEEDKAPLTVANALLSENMSFELRERQGLAYSMGSSVGIQDDWGYLIVSMGTGAQNIETALEGIKDQLAKAAEGGYSQREITKAVNSYIGRRNMRLLTSINRAYYMGLHTFKGQDADYQQKYLEVIAEVTVDDVNRCAEKYFKPEELLIVVVE